MKYIFFATRKLTSQLSCWCSCGHCHPYKQYNGVAMDMARAGALICLRWTRSCSWLCQWLVMLAVVIYVNCVWFGTQKLSWHFFYRENILSSTGYYFEAQFKNKALGDLQWQGLLKDVRVWGIRLKLLRWSLSDLLFYICTGCIWNTCNYRVKLGLLTDIFGLQSNFSLVFCIYHTLESPLHFSVLEK